jgi:hypothetical protein
MKFFQTQHVFFTGRRRTRCGVRSRRNARAFDRRRPRAIVNFTRKPVTPCPVRVRFSSVVGKTISRSGQSNVYRRRAGLKGLTLGNVRFRYREQTTTVRHSSTRHVQINVRAHPAARDALRKKSRGIQFPADFSPANST